MLLLHWRHRVLLWELQTEEKIHCFEWFCNARFSGTPAISSGSLHVICYKRKVKEEKEGRAGGKEREERKKEKQKPKQNDLQPTGRISWNSEPQIKFFSGTKCHTLCNGKWATGLKEDWPLRGKWVYFRYANKLGLYKAALGQWKRHKISGRH